MAEDGPEVVIATYRVKPGEEDAFLELLQRHVPTLREKGLVTDEPAMVYRGTDAEGKTFFVEVFTWNSRSAAQQAHEVPEVAAIWKPMGELTESRLGRPAMEFPHVQPVELG